ncbi:hydroxymethylbilane synthase [Lacrimispora sp.]|jgi:hydroxymethylbilane synthase|uniref:hydroxymethylbilane synthase n=1 Tax=Lacrimispora sp. TaxID=2719234 RepID=UPI0028AC15EA|nr:hydroxymethylbilane synthase [Lacrimispora sp.]
MRSKTIRIGTRRSALAVAQANIMAEALERAGSGLSAELVLKQTEGDRILDKPLLEFGGKGVFVTEFEQALLRGEIDFAVHSAKDLPMELEEGLGIVAVLEREDPRDVLVTPASSDLSGKREIIIGTSSLRRKIQIEEIGKTMWPEALVRCENLRGNVQTRLSKLMEGSYDGILLAAAGLKRLGLWEDSRYHYHCFDCETFIPAGGQGILAVEGRLDSGLEAVVRPLEDEEARMCLSLERKILRLLDAGCHEPIGVYSRLKGGDMEVLGISRRGEEMKRIHLWGETGELEKLAQLAAQGLA